MVYTALVLIVFSIFIMIRNYKNRYVWLLFILVVGLDMAFAASTLYIAKNGNYQYPVNAFFKLDYKIFLYMTGIKINYYLIIRLLNIGIALFSFMVPVFVIDYTRNGLSVFPYKKTLLYAAMVSFHLFYIWFYDPETSFDFYVRISENQGNGDWWLKMIQYMDVFNYTLIFFFLFAPFYLLYKYYSETTIWLKKKQIISISINLFIFNAIFIFVFIIGPFKSIYMYSYQASLLKISTDLSIPVYYYNLMPAIVFIAVQILMFILIKFKGIDTTHFFMEIFINRNIKSLNENLRGVFHSFKNTFFALNIMAEQAHREQDIAAKDAAIIEIKELTYINLNNITRMLNSLKDIKIEPRQIKVIDAVESALKLVYINKSIIIKRNYLDIDACSYCDLYHITEVFANILKNAAEAIASCRSEGGVIEVEINTEHEWVVAKISDNGPGIRKGDLRKIFSPFYTTKAKNTNWGMGLSYVFRVVKAHLGFVTVESSEGQYTTFQVLLPRMRRDEIYE